MKDNDKHTCIRRDFMNSFVSKAKDETLMRHASTSMRDGRHTLWLYLATAMKNTKRLEPHTSML